MITDGIRSKVPKVKKNTTGMELTLAAQAKDLAKSASCDIIAVVSCNTESSAHFGMPNYEI